MRALLLFSLLISGFSLSAQWQNLNSGTAARLNAVQLVTDQVFVAGGEGVFLRSENAGATWANLPIVNAQNISINGVEINDLHFFDAQTGIAVGSLIQNAQLIMRTTDGGLHWTVVLNFSVPGGPEGGLLSLSFPDANTGYTCGTQGRIRKTTDGGLTWNALANTGSYYTYNGIDFVTPDLGYVVGYGPQNDNVILKITNGGVGVTDLASGGLGIHDVDFTSTVNGYIAEPQGYFRITDGLSISGVYYTPDTLGANRLHFIDAETGFALMDRSVRLTQNGGKFWEESQVPAPAGVNLRAFDWSTMGDVGLVAGENGYIAKTVDGGAPYVPLAIFSTNQNYYCKDSLVQLTHPANPALYNAMWLVNGLLVATTPTAAFTPDAYDTDYAVSLILDNGTSSDTFTHIIRTEPELAFDFGQATVSFNSPGCAPVWVQLRVDNPAPNVYYNYRIGGVPANATQLSNGQPLVWQTQELTDTTDIEIYATFFGACEMLEKSVIVTAYLAPYPNNMLNWNLSQATVCVDSVVQISIEGSEYDMQYQLTTPQNDPISDWFDGNGGLLTFSSFPLVQSGYYWIKARNTAGCSLGLVEFKQIQVDQFYFFPYTGDNVAVAGSPYQVYVDSSGLATGIWNFGPNGNPTSSAGFSAAVVFDSTGLYPYAFQYQSQGACNGNLTHDLEVIPVAPAFDINDCTSTQLEPYGWQYRGNSPYVFEHHIDRFGNNLVTGYETDLSVWTQPNNLFLSKFDAEGNLLWHKQAHQDDPGMGGFYRASYGLGLATDTLANIYMVGGFTSDQVNIFGETLTCGVPNNYYYGQGFVFKLNPQGDVVWKIQITAPTQLQTGFCAPADIAFVDDQNIYISIAARGWKGEFPGGGVQQFSNAEAESWLLVITSDGQFVKSLPLGLSSNPGNAMINVYFPPTPSLEGVKATAWGPRIKPAPNGRLMVSGTFFTGSSIAFGAYPVTPLASGGFSGYNHYLAKLHVASGIWENAQCTHGASGGFASPPLYYNPDLVSPAWDVDAAGNTWIAFGANPPVFGNTEVELNVRIGLNFSETTRNTSYLLKYDPAGNRTVLNRNTRMFTSDLLCLENNNVVLFGNFTTAAGFREPGGFFQGVGNAGLNDLFLAHVDDAGNLLGLKNKGNALNDVPLRLSNQRCGSFATLSVGNLDQWHTSVNQEPYVLETYGCVGCDPFVVLQINPVSICGNGEGSFSISASPGLDLQWQHLENNVWVNLMNDAVYSGTTSTTLLLDHPPSVLNNTFYRCRIVGFGPDTLYTNEAKLTVLPVSSITQHPTDANVSIGQVAQFIIQASGSGNQYRWQRFVEGSGLDWFDMYDNSDYTGTGSNNIKIYQVQYFDQHKFRCVVTRNNGCVSTSLSATLNVTTAANEPEQKQTLVVAPNPFTDALSLTFKEPVYSDATLTLYNSTGAVVASVGTKLAGTTWQWAGIDVPVGLYVLEVRTKDGVFTAKVSR
ncbi:MAG: T9SS type A sorting domain-containing protein [Saprospiraceae bacterium]|nr:T9SS type A sorting domain-containing protein [Saprospiraceae bacterium]